MPLPLILGIGTAIATTAGVMNTIKRKENNNNLDKEKVRELENKLCEAYEVKKEVLKKEKIISYRQGYEKAEAKNILYKDTLYRIKSNEKYLEIIVRLIYFIHDNEISLEAQKYLEDLYLVINNEQKKKIEDVIKGIYISKYPLDEIKEEIQKLDKMSINKIKEILNELAVFDKLPIDSRQIKRFKKAFECCKGI